MYEGQITVCKDIIEENWLAYLHYVKQESDKQIEQDKKRMEALRGLEDYKLTTYGTINDTRLPDARERRYYDLSLNGFWNWYIEERL